MISRIEVVDPLQYAGVVSEILQAAWKPPCLHYSVEYLTWQFSFPSDIPRRGAIASLDDQAVGCIAVTSRRFSCARDSFSAYVLSFVGVDPSASRRGMASALYESLLEALPLDVPVFAFAEPESIGERLLLSSFARADFRHHALKSCRAVGYVQRMSASVAPGEVVRDSPNYEEFASVTRSSDRNDIIWTDVAKTHWDHYGLDPRQRVMVTVHDAESRPIGTAMCVSAEMILSQGFQRIPMLEGVALSDGTADAVGALFRFAASRCPPGSTVIASNLSFVDSALIRAAGARALPSSFNAHVFVRGQKNVVETSAALNLEVI